MSTFVCQKCEVEIDEKDAIPQYGDFYCPTCKHALSYFGKEAVFMSRNAVNVSKEALDYIQAKEDYSAKQVVYENPQINMLILEYEDSLKLNPNNLQALMGLAKIYRAKNDLAKAEELFLKAIELKNDLIEAHQQLADLYLKKNDYGKAIGELDLIKQLDSKNYLIDYNLAIVYYQQNDLQNALKYFSQSLDLCQNEDIKEKINSYIRKLSLQGK